MFCRNCGKEIKDGAKFCENCGTPVMAAAEQAQNTAEESKMQENNAPAEVVAPEASVAETDETQKKPRKKVMHSRRNEDW